MTRLRTSSERALFSYHVANRTFIREEQPVTDVLVRDVPDDVVAALDARASRLGLSRSEFLRRKLAQEAVDGPRPVSVEHLVAFGEAFADLLILRS